jgi:hypothetical protein
MTLPLFQAKRLEVVVVAPSKWRRATNELRRNEREKCPALANENIGALIKSGLAQMRTNEWMRCCVLNCVLDHCGRARDRWTD